MKFVCECGKLMKSKEVIIQSIDGNIRFLCEDCFKRWSGEDYEIDTREFLNEKRNKT